MILKSGLILLLVQVLLVGFAWSRLCNPSLREASMDKLSSFGFPQHGPAFIRSRRCLGTALSLLWPQVVGPVEQGVIEESSFNEVPKTLLEYRLDLIRKKAKQEEEKRLIVRDYLKKMAIAQDNFYGYPSYGASPNDYT